MVLILEHIDLFSDHKEAVLTCFVRYILLIKCYTGRIMCILTRIRAVLDDFHKTLSIIVSSNSNSDTVLFHYLLPNSAQAGSLEVFI